MADFSDDESDPEMAEDHEESVPSLDEALEEEELEKNMTLMDPAKDKALFDLGIEPVQKNVVPYGHSTMPSLSSTCEFQQSTKCRDSSTSNSYATSQHKLYQKHLIAPSSFNKVFRTKVGILENPLVYVETFSPSKTDNFLLISYSFFLIRYEPLIMCR